MAFYSAHKRPNKNIPLFSCFSLLPSVFLSFKMAVESELYDQLDVSVDATETEIRKAYRIKAKDLHPDKNPNDPEAAQKFQEMAAAYEILSDPNSRHVYDQEGIQGLTSRGGGHSHGMDAADIFAQFFDANNDGPGVFFDFAGGGPSRRKTKGQDSVLPYDVTLEDLYNGKVFKVNLEKEAICSTCKGSGARGNAKPKPCVKCDSKGWVHTNSSVGHSTIGVSRTVCHECSGTGEKLREKDRCKKCKGEKTVKEKTRQEVVVEKGMSDRQRIILAGAGDEEVGIPAGDVVFVLKADPHASFERSGTDLLTTVAISLSEALLGFSRILITHLDGRGIKVSSPPGKIIKPGDSIIVRGEGMPKYQHPNEKGDLFIIFDVEMPDESWLKSVDQKVLQSLLPSKKQDIEPLPQVINEASFELSDTVGFGEGDENDWEDDENDEDGQEQMDCQHQ